MEKANSVSVSSSDDSDKDEFFDASGSQSFQDWFEMEMVRVMSNQTNQSKKSNNFNEKSYNFELENNSDEEAKIVDSRKENEKTNFSMAKRKSTIDQSKQINHEDEVIK